MIKLFVGEGINAKLQSKLAIDTPSEAGEIPHLTDTGTGASTHIKISTIISRDRTGKETPPRYAER